MSGQQRSAGSSIGQHQAARPHAEALRRKHPESLTLHTGRQPSNVSKLAPFLPRKPPRSHRSASLLQYLFPRTRQHLRDRLNYFRHSFVPSLKRHAQSRLWQAITSRRGAREKRLESFPRKHSRSPRSSRPTRECVPGNDGRLGKRSEMTSYPPSRGYGDDSGQQNTWLSRAEGLPEGSRRKRFAGYLKAANELRVTYQQTAQEAWKNRDADDHYYDDDDDPTSRDYPDAAVVRHGEDQMILFPSYARKHVKRRPRVMREELRQSDSYGRAQDGPGAVDAEFWREQWDKYEDDHAVVDVDVRGWLYTPHRGPMNRKQRLFISLARQLAGLPNAGNQSTPSGSGTPSRNGSPHPVRERLEAHNARKEEELVARQAESILQKGEAKAEMANRGRYSERPGKDSEIDLISLSREGSPDRRRSSGSTGVHRSASGFDTPSPLKQMTSVDGPANDGRPATPVQKRASWSQPAEMSHLELSAANSNLMARLRPFLANPLAGLAISAFFYNDETSQQRTIYTDPNGHFSIRVPLEFVPTHVRVLASDHLSTTEEVIVTSAKGVSVISDIDDTIKHSAIGSGPREIFRNAFIRDLGDLSIEGVRELYTKLAERGAKFHYVSNSPWQLYPVLTKFFKLAGLPPGSFHLKQYSGMLQGIFEPVAERKKGTLDRLATDFPERFFILFGDSGEADLEIYTDFVQENPGRVLGIFIRDVTTTKGPGFFSYSHDQSPNSSQGNSPFGSPPRSPRFSPRMSPRLSPKLNPANYFGNSAKRRSLTRNPKSFSLNDEDDPDLQAAIKASLNDLEAQDDQSFALPDAARGGTPYRTISGALGDTKSSRPTLPPRKPTQTATGAREKNSSTGDLIDLSDDAPVSGDVNSLKPSDVLRPTKPTTDAIESPRIPKKPSNMSVGSRKTTSPQPPKKPTALQGGSSSDMSHVRHEAQDSYKETANTKTPPPKPRRPSTTVPSPQPAGSGNGDVSSTQQGYIAAAEQKLSSAYNALPSMRDRLLGPNPTIGNGSMSKRTPLPPPELPQARGGPSESSKRAAPAPPPPRRNTTQRLPTAPPYTANRAGGLSSTASMPVRPALASNTSQGDVISPYSTRTSTGSDFHNSSRTAPQNRASSLRNDGWEQQPQANKKEAMWRQRWLAASQTLKEKGVMLKSWRVGADIEKDVMNLMDEAAKRTSEGRERPAKPKAWRGNSLEQR